MMYSRLIFLPIGLALLAGCVSMPESQIERIGANAAAPAFFAGTQAPELEIVSSLLEIFEDDQLAALVETALTNNPDLLAAYAQLEEAGFNFKSTRGGLFPTLSADGSATRAKSDSIANTYALGLDASWEVDVWGAIRSDVAASEADLAIQQADYEASQQSLAAQTIQSWFDLVLAKKLLNLAERERDSFASTQRLVDRRYKGGTSTAAELELARTDAANALASSHLRRDQFNQAARALQALLGEYPDAITQEAYEWPSLKRSVPSDIPSNLLLARPDIRAAYERIRAADARVQVAYADLFPSFTLTASGGRSSDSLSDLSKGAFDVWSLAGSVIGPIFEGGALRAEVGAAGKRAEQAYHSYRSQVIVAFLEVENALDSQSYLLLEETARLEALDAARGAETKTRRDYEAGIVDLLDLLEAQRRVFITETLTINLHASRLSNRVNLALALGKGV